MRTIDRLLSEYGESHQNSTNKAIHWICVPAIFWSVTALLWSFKCGFGTEQGKETHYIQLNLAMAALVLVLIYYISLSPKLAIGMLLFSLLCLALCHYLTVALQPSGFPLWGVALIVFALAWIGQFWGHHIEGKRPSFLKDLQFLLIGPVWLMSFIYEKLGVGY